MSTPRSIALIALLALSQLSAPARAVLFNQVLKVEPGAGYVSVPPHASLNFTTGFTVEAWVSVEDTGGECSSLVGKGYTLAYWVGICGTALRSYIQGVSSAYTQGTVPASVWTHVAVTYDGSTRRHYINGVEVGTHVDTGPMTPSSEALRIGSDAQYEHTPTGQIDEVRLWSVARTAAEIQAAMFNPINQAPPGLVAIYHFDGNASDPIGAHHGALTLAAEIGAPTKPIVISGRALRLGPGHGYVKVSHHPSLNFTNGFTAEAWVSLASGTGCRSILGKGYTDNYWLGICGTTLSSYIRGTGTRYDNGALPVGEWTHVAVTFDGTTRRHYIDGAQVGQHTDPGPMTGNTEELRIGSDEDWELTPAGLIDDVRLWNVARSPAQLLSTMFVPIAAAPPGLVAFYRFEGNAADAFGNRDGVLNLNASIETPTPSYRSRARDVVEFYNTLLDNYFITADPIEAAAIDGGSAGPGWGRTGNAFASGGDTLVCRFYGSIAPGPNSHFYTADNGECMDLRGLQETTPATEPRWNYESLDFATTQSPTGACPPDSVPVLRAYNNGAARHVGSNHRITANQAAIDEVTARGWISEGVVMCSPP